MTTVNKAPDYLNPQLPENLQLFDIPVVVADAQSLQGYGTLIEESPEQYPIEIVRWPAQGWRPVDTDSGDEGGTKQGVFCSRWDGDILFGANDAVGGRYILGYGTIPERAQTSGQQVASQILLWHCNYHPDGGQLFFPLEKRPFVVPLALPGDDILPENFVCFWFDGSSGLYIHPNIWHDGVFTLQGEQKFFDKQGAVHARLSVDFAREFGGLLRVDLSHIPSQTSRLSS